MARQKKGLKRRFMGKEFAYKGFASNKTELKQKTDRLKKEEKFKFVRTTQIMKCKPKKHGVKYEIWAKKR